MAPWWVALTFPLVGLAGLCILLRPGDRAKSLAPPGRGPLDALVGAPGRPAASQVDPPAM